MMPGMNTSGQTRGAPRVPLVVVGGGAAGMMAAVAAAEAGTEVILLERGPRPGRKLLITGGSRCNLTHDGRAATVLKSMGPDPRFLRHAVHGFPPGAVVGFFNSLGVPTTVAPDGCVFPESNRAEDVLQALERRMAELGVSVQTRRRVVSVGHVEEGFRVGTPESALLARRLIVATGGVSYPTTGSTGDGYEMAQALGHTVRPVYPALSALETVQTWPGELAGVSLDDVVLKATMSTGKKVTGRGDLLFAGWGISGPASLRLCWQLAETFGPLSTPVEVTLDVCPDVSGDELLARLNRLLQEQPRRKLVGVLHRLGLARKLVEVLCREFDLPGQCRCSETTRATRRRVVTLLKALPMTLRGPREARHATAVRGGVSTEEIDPRTMESNRREGLYFAGEVMDVDGDCGGYNLQIAWSTGRLAGASAAAR